MLITHQLVWEPGRPDPYPDALKIHRMTDDGSLCMTCGHPYGDHAEWMDYTLCPGDRLALVLIRRNETLEDQCPSIS